VAGISELYTSAKVSSDRIQMYRYDLSGKENDSIRMRKFKKG